MGHRGEESSLAATLIVRRHTRFGSIRFAPSPVDNWRSDRSSGHFWHIILARERATMSPNRHRTIVAAIVFSTIVTGCAGKDESVKGDSASSGVPAAGLAAGTTVAGTALASPHAGPAGEWQMPARDYASSRYSELAQITPANAKNLHVAWTFSTGVLRGHEGQPLVVGNTMYIITPYPNVAYAIDLTQPGFPLKWKYARRTRRRRWASRAATS